MTIVTILHIWFLELTHNEVFLTISPFLQLSIFGILLYGSLSLTFLKILYLINYLFFSLWFISFSIMSSRLMIVPSGSFSFFLSEYSCTHNHGKVGACVCVCVYHILSLHPVMNTLKCFCTLALLNNTAVNMHMHLFHEETGFVSWDIYPEVGVFDHLVVLLSIF